MGLFTTAKEREAERKKTERTEFEIRGGTPGYRISGVCSCGYEFVFTCWNCHNTNAVEDRCEICPNCGRPIFLHKW